MRPLERILLRFSALVLALFVAVALLMPAFACGCKIVTSERRCAMNVRRQLQGLLRYANDSEGRFPIRDAWMDGIQPYVESETAFHDREVLQEAYGYAMNAALSGTKAPANPDRTPTVYDSVNPIRNASDLVTSLPKPGRHKGRNNMGYADGHAKMVLIGKTP